MVITLNGERHELPAPLSVSALLTQLKIDPRRVAVEHNLIVLKRATFDSTIVREGDQVEIVNFVGGGLPTEAPGTLGSEGGACRAEARGGRASEGG